MNKLNYWWEVVIFGQEETITITAFEAGKLKQAMNSGHSHLQVHGDLIAASAIKQLRQTDKRITENEAQNLLQSGVLPATSEPIINPETGYVMWRWAKMTVSKRKYDNYYAVHSDYHKMGDYYGDGVWVAFRKPLETNQRLSDTVEWCDDEESKILTAKIQSVYA